jgi:aspartate racemase
MSNQKTIGILAVITECQKQYGAKLDEEFPHMIIYSLPTPFYVDRPIDHDKMKSAVKAGLQKLESVGVSFIAVPCNTVHAYFDELKLSIKVKLLNIIEESMRDLKQGKRIALIATAPTIQSGAYQKFIERRGAEVVHSETIQTSVNKLLADVKAGRPRSQLDAEWMELLTLAKHEGADSAIIACTDLSIFAELKDGLAVTDSSTALARSIVTEYLK